MTKTFEEVISGIRKAKKGVEVREDLAQMGEYCQQFTQEAGTRADAAKAAAETAATNAKASEKKATDAVAGIEQTKTDAVQAVQNAQTTATTAVQQAQTAATDAVTAKQTEAVQAVDDERDAALQQVADSTQAAQTAAANAAASEQTAQASKEAAATSAGDAASSATAASGSASAAATSESNAASSAQSANTDADRAEAAALLAGTRANTDKTLKTENAPADAAAVGTALDEKANKDVIYDSDGNIIFYSKAAVDELLAGKLGLHDTADNSNKLGGYNLRLSDHPLSISVLVQTVDKDGSMHIDFRSDASIGLTAIVAYGPGYIRFGDGTQICYGAAFNGQIPEVVTYPVAFVATPFTTVSRHWGGASGATNTEFVWIYDTSSTGFKIGSNSGIYAHWISAGRWK
jgi:hypothetical protein